MNDMNYSFNIGKIGNIDNTNKDAKYNQAGAILFTKDTHELFINLNDITKDDEAKIYRKQVNSLYATAITDFSPGTSSVKFDVAKLQKMYKDISTNTINLQGKMAKEHPTGNGVFNFGENNLWETYPNDKDKSSNSIMIGYYLKQGKNAQNSIINGKYNKPIENALLTVGNGIGDNDKDRANLFVVTPDYSYFKNLYIVSNDATGQPNDEDRVMTQKDGNKIKTIINDLSPRPFIPSNDPPDKNITDENELAKIRNLFWINTSKGNGVLNYWKPNTVGDGGSWVEVSAIFT